MARNGSEHETEFRLVGAWRDEVVPLNVERKLYSPSWLVRFVTVNFAVVR